MVIYKTTNNLNGKIYIGQSVEDNPNYLGSGTLLLIEITSSGRENFTKEIIDIANNIEELNIKEKYWIQYYDSTNPKIGYNLSQGGTGFRTEKLASKIQVLLTENELNDLISIIMTKSIKNKQRLQPVSSYVRLLLKEHIAANQAEQSSYLKETIKHIKNK